MKWYTVDEDFLDYLRNFETRIPKINYGDDKLKPFFGSLFEIGDLVYITQVSHPQKRHTYLKEDVDFIKLYDNKRLVAVVNLNYMFPVHKNKLIEIEYGKIENFRIFDSELSKSGYITLLKKEMKQITSKQVNTKAIDLYKRKYDYPNDRVSQRCIDFKKLEQKCIEYKK
jgi:protein AbiQ